MLTFIKDALRSKAMSLDSDISIRDLPSIHIELDEEIPRYPPFMKGLPSTHPDKLIDTQRELIDQIREAGIASSDIFDEFYLASLRRFASYAHLLPASQTHHHRGAGGLLRHAAEVSLWSLQSGDRVLLPGEQAPRRRRELEPRWHLAVFLAALCHDVGKPVTDLVVTSRDGEKVWNPFIEDLYSWASRNDVDRYFLHWRKNRAKKHTAVSSLIAERIISPKSLAWIADGDTELVLWMMETINGQPSAENLIHDLVIRSDQVSVERDLRSLGVTFTGYEIGLPVERFLVDIMRRMVRDGVWDVNQPGSRLWHIDGHLYLVWPSAGEEIAAIINQEKIPGLPRTPNSLLEMLVDRKLGSIRDDQVKEKAYWYVAPDVLAEKIPNIRLTAIRLRDPSLVIDPPPASVPGKVFDREEPEEMPIDISPPNQPIITKQTIALEQPQESDRAGNDLETLQTQRTDKLDGPVGDALMAFSEAIKSGEKSYEALVHVDPSGVLCLKWPDALENYGLEGKVILDELFRRNWLALDPLSPFRKVMELDVGSGTPWKVVRLQAVVKQIMAIEHSPVNPTTPTMPVSNSNKPTVLNDDARQEDTRLKIIQNIVTTLRVAIKDGVLDSESDGKFVWVQSRKAEPVLIERLKLDRTKIMRLGSVVPDVFMCQTRNKAHSYRIPG